MKFFGRTFLVPTEIIKARFLSFRSDFDRRSLNKRTDSTIFGIGPQHYKNIEKKITKKINSKIFPFSFKSLKYLSL
jgi:hypothetical protein